MKDMVYLLEVMAVAAFAVSGILLARRKGMDPVGAFALAFVTAFGGGTLRDLILDIHPVYWIRNEEMPLLVFALALALSYVRNVAWITDRLILLPDSIGLALFSIAGAQVSLSAGHDWFISSLLGVCSAVAGGVIRDTLANEIPYIFQRAHLYATCSFLGCCLYALLERILANRPIDTLISLTFILLLRLLAAKYKITLTGRVTPET